MRPPSYMRSIVNRNVIMRRMTVHYVFEMKLNLTPNWKADNDLGGEKFLVGCGIGQSTALNNTFLSECGIVSFFRVDAARFSKMSAN